MLEKLGILDSLMPQQIGLFNLAIIGIKLFILVFIIKFLRRKISDPTAVTLITLGLAYLLLFRWAWLWIPLLLIVIILPHGPIDVMFDLALGGGGGEAKKKKESVRKRKKA